jgi:hypothetical protein
MPNDYLDGELTIGRPSGGDRGPTIEISVRDSSSSIVYFAQRIDGGPIKIGCSEKVEIRRSGKGKPKGHP